MWGHLRQIWENFRILSDYTEQQKRALARLQTLCLTKLGLPNLHDTILETDNNGIPTENSNRLANQLIDLMQGTTIDADSYWASYANTLLNNIGNYLALRRKAYSNTGYSNDPTNLLCLQLAHWLKHRLMVSGLNNDMLQEIKRWSRYLEAVELDQEILSIDERMQFSPSATAKSIIADIKRLLEIIHNIFNLELCSGGIKESLDSLINRGRNFTAFCFSFLFYISHEIPDAPLNFDIININTNFNPEIDRIINSTALGYYLGNLARTDAIRELFFPYSLAENSNTLTPLLDQAVVQCHLLENDDNRIKDIFNSADPTGKKSGIIFLSQSDCLEVEAQIDIRRSFMLLCCYLEIFARVLHFCKEAADLSRSKGEILLCKISTKHLVFLMSSIDKLISEILHHCTNLKAHATQLQPKLRNKGIKDNPWLQTQAQAAEKFRSIDDAQDNFSQLTSRVRTQIDIIHLKEQQTTKKLRAFIHGVNRMMHDLPWLAQIPHSENTQSIEQVSPNIEVLEEDIERIDRKSTQSITHQSSKDSYQLLAKVARQYGYNCKDVKGDGSCFYHAVAHQLCLQLFENSDEMFEEHAANLLRQIVAEHFDRHPDIYQDPNLDPRTRIEILRNVYREWADYRHALAVSQALNITIVILWNDGNVIPLRRNNPSHTIYLGFIPELHYQSLVRDPSISAELEFESHIGRAWLDTLDTPCHLENLINVARGLSEEDKVNPTAKKKDLLPQSPKNFDINVARGLSKEDRENPTAKKKSLPPQPIKTFDLLAEFEKDFISPQVERALKPFQMLFNKYDKLKQKWQRCEDSYEILADIPEDDQRRVLKEKIDNELKKIEAEKKAFCNEPNFKQYCQELKARQAAHATRFFSQPSIPSRGKNNPAPANIPAPAENKSQEEPLHQGAELPLKPAPAKPAAAALNSAERENAGSALPAPIAKPSAVKPAAASASDPAVNAPEILVPAILKPVAKAPAPALILPADPELHPAIAVGILLSVPAAALLVFNKNFRISILQYLHIISKPKSPKDFYKIETGNMTSDTLSQVLTWLNPKNSVKPIMYTAGTAGPLALIAKRMLPKDQKPKPVAQISIAQSEEHITESSATQTENHPQFTPESTTLTTDTRICKETEEQLPPIIERDNSLPELYEAGEIADNLPPSRYRSLSFS